MATATGRETADLKTRICSEPKSFTLGQLLRLLGFLHAQGPEQLRRYIQDNISIRSWLSLAFPSTEITALEIQEGQPKYRITATNFGLYSTMGPLPTLYTEELLDEARHDQSVSRDFLDILNNHLSHLRYAASSQNRLERRSLEDENRGFLHLQACLAGQTEAFRENHGLPKVLLTEIFAHRTRSAAQLERFLGYILSRNDIRVEQCIERLAPIPMDQRCRLGESNASLGRDTMLGMCLRDSTGKFRVHLEQVEESSMHFFLPENPGHRLVARAIRHFLDAPLDFELCLHPMAAPQTPNILGQNSAMGFYLGEAETLMPVRVFWGQAVSL